MAPSDKEQYPEAADLYDENGESLYDPGEVDNDSMMVANPGGLLANRE